jgi:quinol monooxygenase YgiN
MSDQISWLLEVKIRPGKFDDFRAVARDLITQTQSETTTLDYEWHLSPDNSVCHIFERYADSAAVLRHVEGFHLHAERFFASCEAVNFSVYGPANDAAKAMLADLNPVYFSTLGGFSR